MAVTSLVRRFSFKIDDLVSFLVEQIEREISGLSEALQNASPNESSAARSVKVGSFNDSAFGATSYFK